MHKRLSIAFILLLAFATFSVSAANSNLDFTLVNQTGVTISQFFISPTSVDDWQEDVLGVDVLDDGDSVDIVFSRHEDARLFDMKVIDSEDDSYEWFKIPLDEVNILTLSFNKAGVAIASWK